MTNETTTNAVEDDSYRSPEEIIAALERFIKGPRIIGNLHGYPVYVDDSLPPGGFSPQRLKADFPSNRRRRYFGNWQTTGWWRRWGGNSATVSERSL